PRGRRRCGVVPETIVHDLRNRLGDGTLAEQLGEAQRHSSARFDFEEFELRTEDLSYRFVAEEAPERFEEVLALLARQLEQRLHATPPW
ncbi:MAG TPA: hypothetical protein VKU40_18685, partial [Thermoanaerobaculia bacterium]|nr:hypothetical protein [Thermoanaerobaculia bacterium]